MARLRYHPKALKQTMRFQGKLIGCTDTALAMCIDAATSGGCIVNEQTVRDMSDERHPDPASPGLNQQQLVGVAHRLHVEYTNRSGANRIQIERSLAQNRRIVAQLWYAGIGGGNIGHAVYLEALTGTGKARIVDPMKGRYSYIDQTRFFDAMRTLAEKAGVDGLLWGETHPNVWLSSNQKPSTT